MKITEQNQNLILKIGLAVAGYFVVIVPILQAVGIKDDKDDKEVKDAETGNGSEGWNPDYYKNKSGAVISNQTAEQLAFKIYDAFGYFYDDEDAVYSAFRALNSKKDLSKLASTFQLKYGMDLWEQLKGGAGWMAWPFGGLNNSELAIVLAIVNKLT